MSKKQNKLNIQETVNISISAIIKNIDWHNHSGALDDNPIECHIRNDIIKHYIEALKTIQVLATSNLELEKRITKLEKQLKINIKEETNEKINTN